jgi:hypothetical protein
VLALLAGMLMLMLLVLDVFWQVMIICLRRVRFYYS